MSQFNGFSEKFFFKKKVWNIGKFFFKYLEGIN